MDLCKTDYDLLINLARTLSIGTGEEQKEEEEEDKKKEKVPSRQESPQTVNRVSTSKVFDSHVSDSSLSDVGMTDSDDDGELQFGHPFAANIGGNKRGGQFPHLQQQQGMVAQKEPAIKHLVALKIFFTQGNWVLREDPILASPGSASTISLGDSVALASSTDAIALPTVKQPHLFELEFNKLHLFALAQFKGQVIFPFLSFSLLKKKKK